MPTLTRSLAPIMGNAAVAIAAAVLMNSRLPSFISMDCHFIAWGRMASQCHLVFPQAGACISCITIHLNPLQSAMIFSYGNTIQGGHGGLLDGEHRGDRAASGFGDLITVGLGDFLD